MYHITNINKGSNKSEHLNISTYTLVNIKQTSAMCVLTSPKLHTFSNWNKHIRVIGIFFLMEKEAHSLFLRLESDI